MAMRVLNVCFLKTIWKYECVLMMAVRTFSPFVLVIDTAPRFPLRSLLPLSLWVYFRVAVTFLVFVFYNLH